MTDYKSVKTELDATAEMLSIIHSDDSLMLGSVHDVTHELKRLSLPGTYMQVAEIAMLRRTIDSIAQISTFFHGDKVDDGAEGSRPYPVLSSMTAALSAFPGVARGIDRILDKFGNIKDNASPELAGIRRALSA
ncbi:MAG: endonuclease MutS2, partial [Muribaculaceae bacterium]|nr:endonuclease MutS2 [Muribaculaceae bacterium]